LIIRFTSQMGRGSLPITAYDVGHVKLIQRIKHDQNHWPFFQLVCCYQGEGKVHIADHGDIELTPGKILFFKPNTRHNYSSDRNDCSLSWVSFQGYLVETMCEEHQLQSGFALIHDRNYQKFQHDIKLIFDQVDESFPMEKISTILYRMIIEYFRKLKSSDLQIHMNDDKQDQLVMTAVHWMKQHIHEPADVTLLAATLNISRQHLSRLFRQTFGVSTKAYWTNLKILHSQKDLIDKAHLPVKDIASSLGFVNASHFNRVFRLETGISPLQFRLSYWVDGLAEETVERHDSGMR
jgi:AraC-like DNA-binding protein